MRKPTSSARTKRSLEQPQSAAERKATERARKRKLGLVLLQAWIHPEDRSRIKVYLAELASAGPQTNPPKRGRPRRARQGATME